MRRALIAVLCLGMAFGAFLLVRQADSADLTAQQAASQIVTTPEAAADSGLSAWQSLVQRVRAKPFNLVPFIIFALAILHAFCTGWFRRWGEVLQRRHAVKLRRAGISADSGRAISFGAEILTFLGEVEVVFGLWTIPLIIAISYQYNWHTAVAYLNSRDYTEPLFVVVVMTLASTRPILRLVESIIHLFARMGGQTVAAWWLSLLTIGPLLGSLVTEPGAMTITAILLSKQLFSRRPSRTLAYATLGLLFVNISTGGDLTSFAAPPILIVAKKWAWSTPFMFTRFGWKSVIGIVISNLLYYAVFRRELRRLEQVTPMIGKTKTGYRGETRVPVWITVVHVALLSWIVFASHELVIFIGTFLIFLAFYQATLPHQRPLNLRSPLLVGLFLTGLVIHGGLQGWWIEPLLSQLSQLPLFLLAVGLTTVNDNAAITYLSSLAPQFSTAQKYAVVAGAVTGGGLTIIANAPNPAGAQLLSRYFRGGISHLGLFLGALAPTIIVGAAFVLLGWGIMVS